MSTFDEVRIQSNEIYFRTGRDREKVFSCSISVTDNRLVLHFSGHGHDQLEVSKQAANDVVIVVGKQEKKDERRGRTASKSGKATR